MRLVAILAATAVVALIGTSAMAQTTTPSTTTTTPMTTTTKPAGTMAKPKAATTTQKTAQTDISKACSAQADAKGLHGKERSKFRSQCKKSGGKM
ncbi:PsiF family protein [Rhizobium jaguaris]|uniref:Phosphate starvation-inducible protein PsiF n=1 Tax=Rhizobium jaguaris TaxID=1312183 RepID=A0A387FKI2_9HYPH|nr:PsiF family protein [Rhizobium jaguaris]AYG57947.1 hypothetical protein CCGE525_03285 [Rhizobium jaguaris]